MSSNGGSLTATCSRLAVSVDLSLPNELSARHRLDTRVVLPHVGDVTVIVRDSDDPPNHIRRVPNKRLEGLNGHAQSPATATVASNGTSEDTVGLCPPSTATHSRMLSAKITTTEIMKNAATPASR